MLAFVARRLAASAGILLAGTFVAYVLVALSGDPLASLRQDTTPGREQRIAELTERLDLDTPVPLRYLRWLGSAAQCLLPLVGECDLGESIRGQEVTVLLGRAMATTVQLVAVATVTAIVLGVLVGIVTALRQYSGLDYAVTLASFVFVSLPLFWLAVLLKEYVAIDVNDWLADPTVSVPAAAIAGVAVGIAWAAIVGGGRRRVWTQFAVAGAITAGTVLVLSTTGWFARPGLGPVVVAGVAFAGAVGLTALLAGFGSRRVLGAALVTAAVGAVANVAAAPLLRDPGWPALVGLFAAALAVAAGIGYVAGAPQRRLAAQVSVGVGVVVAATVVLDRMLGAWGHYYAAVNGRVIATFGARTPNYDGGTWGNLLDAATHLLLPTLALIAVSVATYSRYVRASMLDVMGHDHVRTARAKGLTERAVVMRHALRNSLIPITTLVAYDFAALIGGAVVTETVFAWPGMGSMFVTALRAVDPNPAMAFFVVTATAAVGFNLLADIAYAYLDPRIRVS